MPFERWLYVLSLRWRSLFRRRHVDGDLDDEIRHHVELAAEEHVAKGMDAATARRLVIRQLGGVDRVKERCRDARGTELADTIALDVRYALRTLRRNPAFAIVAVVTLALGIGANAAVFSLADGILLAGLPYPDADRLVSVTGTFPGGAFAAMRDQVRSLDVGAYAEGHTFILSGDGEPLRVAGTLVSAELMPLLGVKPALGRWLRPGEDLFPRDRFVILSHALWTSRFGRDEGVVGRFLQIDGVRREVVAVMPPAFAFPSSRTHVWIPIGLDARDTPRYWAGDFMPVIGRVREGVTRAQVQIDIRAFQTRVRGLFPWAMPDDWNRTVGTVTLQEAIVGGARPRLLMLVAGVIVVLMIACANVANLSLSRAAAREREIAIRTAIGAAPRRIARQLFTESLVLALLGAAAGLVVGGLALDLLKHVLPPDTPRLAEVGLNLRVLLFTGALAITTGCASGFAPVLHARRLRLRAGLEHGGRSGGEAVAGPLRSVLTVVQIACSVLLVIAAGLLVRSLWTLSHVDPGFRADELMTARISPSESVCRNPERCLAFYRLLEGNLQASAGVSGAALVNTLPLTGAVAKRSLDVEGYTVPASETAPLFWLHVITPAYFHVMDIRVDAGRAFTAADVAGPPVAIVSSSTARRFWPGVNPVGSRVRFAGDEAWRTIVGVVGDVNAYDMTKTVPGWMAGTIYVPQATNATLEDGRIPAGMTVVLRTPMDSVRAAALLRLATGPNGDVVIGDVRSMRAIMADAVAAPAAATSLLVTMAGLAVALGCVGVYGVLSFLVSRRLRELAIRVALGARRADVFWLVIRDVAALCAAGVVIGIAGAAVTTRWLSSELYGISATDPLTYATVAGAVSLVTLAACYVPTRRAMGVDPLMVLREP